MTKKKKHQQASKAPTLDDSMLPSLKKPSLDSNSQATFSAAENFSEAERVSSQQTSFNDVNSPKVSSTCKSITLGDEDSDASSSSGEQQQVQQLLQKQSRNSADQVFDKNAKSPSGEEILKQKATDKLTSGNVLGATNKATFSSLFAENRSPSQGYKLQNLEQQGDVILLDDEDIDDLSEAFGFALIGYIAGKSTGKQAIIQCCKSWNVNHQLHFHSSGWIVIKFDNEIDRNAVLEKGPYIIYGRPFLLKIMPELFDFNDLEFTKVPVWVQIPNLPLQLWNNKALSKIASKIGSPIQSDKLTQSKGRLSFARLLIEIDVSKELLNEVQIKVPDGSTLSHQVMYEFVPKFCRACKAIGHQQDNCPYHKAAATAPTAPSKPAANEVAKKGQNMQAAVVELANKGQKGQAAQETRDAVNPTIKDMDSASTSDQIQLEIAPENNPPEHPDGPFTEVRRKQKTVTAPKISNQFSKLATKDFNPERSKAKLAKEATDKNFDRKRSGDAPSTFL